ncbi:hypothetical protein IWX63_003054 [Arthrobacter sp. CAN_A2]|uniref:hypothetical protein n=1 Tax=Arthrobacter sp. CAN_A2 TaxID=2787718 RepID=UPI0018EF8BB0
MRISEAGQDFGSLLATAQGQQMKNFEALRHGLVQNLLKVRQRCEEVNAAHADGGSARTGCVSVSAEQVHAQGVLCAAVRAIEDVDAVLHQMRQENKLDVLGSGKSQRVGVVS